MVSWRDAPLAEAEAWLRTPWMHRARVQGVRGGVDCAQSLIAWFSGAGLIEAFDPGDYPADWMLHRDEERFIDILARYAVEVPADQPAARLRANVAVFRFGRTYSHGALIESWPRIIHAYRPERSVVWGDATLGGLQGRAVRFFQLRGAA